jgi:septal ring factor EnvC (AmiA/AmiB activator)
MRLSAILLLAGVVVAAFRPCAAVADAATETRLREALRTATSQLGALEDERASWQGKEAALQKELDSLRSELATAKRSHGKASDVAELNRRVAEQAETNGKLTQSLAQCQSATREAGGAAQAGEDERARLAAQVAAFTEKLAASEARNGRMYAVGKEIIDWLSKVGVGGALAAREPLLGLKRVELENAAQDYADKLLDQKAKP